LFAVDGGNKKISPKATYIKCVKTAYFFKKMQKLLNNWRCLSLVMLTVTLCPLLTTPLAGHVDVSL